MLDELLEAVNQRAPGFGGMYWSGRGEMTMLVTPKGSNYAIEAAAREVFSDLPWTTVTSVRFAAARFEVLELQAHRLRLPEVVGGPLIWTDFDERSNVVRAGVEETADLAQLSALMRGSGAPDGAVVFEHSKRPVPAAYLTATQSPSVGGIQIELRDTLIANNSGGSSTLCSLSFNVGVSTDDAHRYFMTAAHCTGTSATDSVSVFNNEHALVYQPDSATNPSPIGFEVSAPDSRTGLSNCPNLYTCKYSDAALFKYYGGSPSNFTYLAKDSSYSSTVGVNGSLFRVDSFHVVNDISEANLLAADTLPGHYDTFMHKVGRTTGWTFGPVTHTCVTYVWTIPLKKALLCQYYVASSILGGDSGAPAFWWYCCNPNEAWIGGLVSTGFTNSLYGFSSITGIKNDFANLISY
jgi:hypothetical protein